MSNLVSYFEGSFAAREMNAYSEAGSVAEEVISNINTVIAFGGQHKEVQRYVVSRKFRKRKIFFFLSEPQAGIFKNL